MRPAHREGALLIGSQPYLKSWENPPERDAAARWNADRSPKRSNDATTARAGIFYALEAVILPSDAGVPRRTNITIWKQ